MNISLRPLVALICAALALIVGPRAVWAAAQEPLLAEPYQDMGRYIERSDDAGVDDYAGRVQNPYSLENMDTTFDSAEAPAPPAKPVPAFRPYAAPRPSAPPPVAQPGCVTAAESCDAACGNFCDACSCRPTWTIRVDGLAMNRSRADYGPLASDLRSGDVLLSTDDLDFDWKPGFRLAFQRRLGCTDWDLEVVYFQVDGFNAGASVTSPELFVFTAPNFVQLAGRDVGMEFAYGSQLYSTEINLKRCVGPVVTLLGGFRWIEMGENFSGSVFDDRGSLPFWITDVNNHLYGGQVGADVKIWDRGGPLSLRGIGKAGIYVNYVDQGTESPRLRTSVSASDKHTAFVGEFELVAVYQVNQRLALRAGYQMLWLDGVALAPEQIPFTDLDSGVAAVDPGSDAFYHGLVTGVELTW